MTVKTPLEARLYRALKRITLYDSSAKLRRSSEKNWHLPFDEAIEMAYENVQDEARVALEGVRFPKPKPTPDVAPVPSDAQGGGK